ncbi:TPA: ATP-binding protein, partial [Enterococcus faecalis]
MHLKIRKFSILDSLNSKAFHETFEKGLNLIVGEKDSGKTSLARAIMYTFGCDVRNFELQNQNNNLIFVIEFTVNQSDYILVRRKLVEKGKGKNYFKLFSNNESHTYFSTKDFKDKLNEVLNIDLETLDKQGEKTKLYPNHLFLPFYMDQDYSWQTYLNSTFSNINFINNYKKIVLEFYTGMRSNEYYRLSLRKNEQKKRLL